jgi:hypothetical protein
MQNFALKFCHILLSLPVLLWGSTTPASAVVIGPVVPDPGVSATPPASFVVAAKGIRHALNPRYSPSGWFANGHIFPSYQYTSTMEIGPPGMTVSQNGVLEWIPPLADIGSIESVTVRFRVTENGSEIFTVAYSYTMRVVAEIPRMLEPSPEIAYERSSSGSIGIAFQENLVSDTDRKLFRWSLIAAPIGVTVNASGGIDWPNDFGYAREEPYVFKVRFDYETANGPLSDEVTYSRRVLPAPATNDPLELRSYRNITQPNGMLGFSTAAGDGWIAAGEPYPGAGVTNAGCVRLWQESSSNRRYYETLALEPGIVSGGHAFGASVSISERTASRPTRLAVGAPEATVGTSHTAVGQVYIYACDAGGIWSREARLDPPVPLQSSLYFGGWVSILGDTLIASIEGANTAGSKTGALAVYRHDGTAWSFSQLLQAPVPAAGDFFSYPADQSGEWIAAAANEDDDLGNNTGAVHLFQKQGNQYVHRQQIHAPVPETGTLFGERLLIEGPWLFISSFRESGNRGAVHVFKLRSGVWNFHQSLLSPFAKAGSAFGVGLAQSDDLLTVSAPGFLMGDASIDGSNSEWKGITQFRLEGDSWKWLRHVAHSPDATTGPYTWGYSLAQIGPGVTVASIPDLDAYGQYPILPFAGRLFIHRWPEIQADPFATVLAALPPVGGSPATATGDANQNGVPNLIDWLMGQNPGSVPSGSEIGSHLGKKPFVKMLPGAQGFRFMVPKLRSALRHRLSIDISHDLIHWQVVPDARWEALEDVDFPLPYPYNNFFLKKSFHPVFIPTDAAEVQRPIFVRMGAVD